MKLFRVILLTSSILTLAACSSTKEECDPSKSISFIGKISCNISGNYDERVSEKEKELLGAQEKQNRLDKEYKKVKGKVDKSKTELKHRTADLNKLQKSIRSDVDQLKQKAQGKQNIVNQINQIEQQLKNIQGSGLTEEQQQTQIKKLQRKLQLLQKATGI